MHCSRWTLQPVGATQSGWLCPEAAAARWGLAHPGAGGLAAAAAQRTPSWISACSLKARQGKDPLGQGRAQGKERSREDIVQPDHNPHSHPMALSGEKVEELRQTLNLGRRGAAGQCSQFAVSSHRPTLLQIHLPHTEPVLPMVPRAEHRPCPQPGTLSCWVYWGNPTLSMWPEEKQGSSVEGQPEQVSTAGIATRPNKTLQRAP